MKKLMIALLIPACFSGIVGCKKDSDSRSSSGGSMTCTLDGASWEAMANRAGGSIVAGVSNVTGVADDSSAIGFTVQEAVALNGTYDLGYTSGNAAFIAPDQTGVTPSWSSNGHTTCTGTLHITALDAANKKISGTFSFKAYRATDSTFREVTAGVFTNLTYATSFGGNGNNSFSVKIDGVNWSPYSVEGINAGGGLILTASDASGDKTVALYLIETITNGTYALAPSTNYFAQYNPSSSVYTQAVSGSITITQHNTSTKHIVGTFNFVSEPLAGPPPPSFNLTNGAFDIEYN